MKETTSVDVGDVGGNSGPKAHGKDERLLD
jgi:hypothetical protein